MKNNDVFSLLTARAKIISKNTFINSKDRSLHSVYIFQTNFLTFKLDDSSRIVPEVSPFIFASLLETM